MADYCEDVGASPIQDNQHINLLLPAIHPDIHCFNIIQTPAPLLFIWLCSWQSLSRCVLGTSYHLSILCTGVSLGERHSGQNRPLCFPSQPPVELLQEIILDCQSVSAAAATFRPCSKKIRQYDGWLVLRESIIQGPEIIPILISIQK